VTDLLIQGDARRIPLADGSVQCVVTSPPYWGLRDYGVDGQLGLEATPDEYVTNIVSVFREVRRVLRDDGTLWLNLGDSYAGSWGAQSRGGPPSASSPLRGNGHVGGGPKLKSLSAIQIAAHPKGTHTGSLKNTPNLKPKDLVGIPWKVAFALQADGWYLRSDIIWSKPNPMPESVTDRPTKAHEYVFLLTKSARYYYDADAVREPHVRPGEVNHGGGTRRSAGRSDSGKGVRDGTCQYNPNGRNARTVWTIATKPYPEAHFATFPPELAERCIKAGTSEKGACAECGAPWERVVEGKPGYGTAFRTSSRYVGQGNAPTDTYHSGDLPDIPLAQQRRESWRPTCDHGTEPVPCVVFDPFSGSGTTVDVARHLNRRGVGLELSVEYLQLAQRRTAQRVLSL
jgi:DNA modification methylase